MISEGGIALSGFDDLLPGKVAQSGGFDGEQTTLECGEIGIDVVVADARGIFEHLAVANPMVADLASWSVSWCEIGKVFGPGSVFREGLRQHRRVTVEFLPMGGKVTAGQSQGL